MRDTQDVRKILNQFVQHNNFVCIFGEKSKKNGKTLLGSHIVCNLFSIEDFKDFSVKCFSYIDSDDIVASTIYINDKMEFVGTEHVYSNEVMYIQYTFHLVESDKEFLVWIRG